MADLIFEKSKKELSWPAKKLKWSAVSGPHRLGPLPSGLYDIGRREITDYTNQIDRSYRDKTGRGFFVPIYPRFSTHRGKNGGRLGIHPDGNIPGTLGCIGITDNSAKSFHDAMKAASPGAKLLLIVKE